MRNIFNHFLWEIAIFVPFSGLMFFSNFEPACCFDWVLSTIWELSFYLLIWFTFDLAYVFGLDFSLISSFTSFIYSVKISSRFFNLLISDLISISGLALGKILFSSKILELSWLSYLFEISAVLSRCSAASSLLEIYLSEQSKSFDGLFKFWILFFVFVNSLLMEIFFSFKTSN